MNDFGVGKINCWLIMNLIVVYLIPTPITLDTSHELILFFFKFFVTL